MTEAAAQDLLHPPPSSQTTGQQSLAVPRPRISCGPAKILILSAGAATVVFNRTIIIALGTTEISANISRPSNPNRCAGLITKKHYDAHLHQDKKQSGFF